jgi:hypothetical protein
MQLFGDLDIPKNKGCNCEQTVISAKLRTGRRGKKKKNLTGRSPLRRRIRVTTDRGKKHKYYIF